MKSWLAFALFIQLCFASDCELKVQCPRGTCVPNSNEDNDVSFDFADIRGFDEQWQKLGLRGSNWYVSVCGETTKTCRGKRGVAIQVNVTDDSLCYILARDTVQAFSLINDNDVYKGITVTYGNGDEHDNCPAKRTVTINIQCGKTTSISEAEPSRSNPCHTVITMESRAGCPIVKPVNASPLVTPSSTTSVTESHEFGGISRFLFIVFLGLCVYCVVFSIYNYHIHGERGLQVLPHPNFWCDTLPNFIREITGRCFDLIQDCWSWFSDRLRGFSHRSSSTWLPGSGPPAAEYEKIRDGSTNTGANFYDVENDAELDEEDDPPSSQPASTNKTKPKSST